VFYLSVTETNFNLFLALYFSQTYQGTLYAKGEIYNQDQVMWACVEGEAIL